MTRRVTYSQVELLDVERQMEEELVDEFKQVERVIATRTDAVEGDSRFLVKVCLFLDLMKQSGLVGDQKKQCERAMVKVRRRVLTMCALSELARSAPCYSCALRLLGHACDPADPCCHCAGTDSVMRTVPCPLPGHELMCGKMDGWPAVEGPAVWGVHLGEVR